MSAQPTLAAAAPGDERFGAIERILAEDPRARGIGRLVQWGALEGAARALAGARRAMVVSGFFLPVPQRGETDGPPGAKAIGEALQALGAEVAYVTDAPNAPLFEAMGLAVTPYAPDLLERLAPTHLVSTERPGRAADGRYYSMSGRDVTPYTAPIDELFLRAPARGIPTVAIGDGGNEIGMGNVQALVARDVPNGAQIASVVPADHLIVAGVSNFGAYGLVAALSLLAGRDLLPSDERAAGDVLACVAAGGCCGHTFRNEPLVDGLPLEDSLALLARLRALLG
jgi:D-glutamate cyclase-like, C-terminal